MLIDLSKILQKDPGMLGLALDTMRSVVQNLLEVDQGRHSNHITEDLVLHFKKERTSMQQYKVWMDRARVN